MTISDAPTSSVDASFPQEPARKPLTDAARRALAEAQARREAMQRREQELADQRELGGREGPDPVRYADWENNGIASDF